MKQIRVSLKDKPYTICAGSPLSRIGSAFRELSEGKISKVLVVTQPFAKKHFLPQMLRSLKSAGLNIAVAIVPDGEKYKTLDTVHKLYRECIRHGLDRSSCIIALGGGVTGDMAGFAAATYLRGIRLVHVPTTLLAMVDSSIGGKTGVDLPESKNSVGAFYQPALVWIDPSLLKTLPTREWRNGMAEVIKYGVISDAKLFALLERTDIFSKPADSPFWADVIARCAGIKALVVSQDEKETRGVRETLNFGHTLGHAIESVTGYKVYKHGEAISIGMRAAGEMALKLGLWTRAEQARVTDLLTKTGLPVRLTRALPADKIMRAMMKDKKVRHKEIRFVLPVKIGKVVVRKVSPGAALYGLNRVQPR